MTESSTWPSTRDPQGPMKKSISLLAKQKIQSSDADALPESTKRFADGSRWKIEIPSVEGPAAFKVVLEEAKKQKSNIQGRGRENIDDALRVIKTSKSRSPADWEFVSPG